MSMRTKSIDLSEKSPGRIDFSVGMPDPETFPIDEIREIASYIDPSSLEYVPNAGCTNLREFVAGWMRCNWHLDVDASNVLITNGSMEAIFLASLVLGRDKGAVIADCPGYWRASETFENLGLEIIENEVPFSGFDINNFEKVVRTEAARGTQISFYYCMPDVQNPTGSVMSAEDRMRLIQLAEEFQFAILEDDAKAKLVFKETDVPALWSIAGNAQVIRTGTLSKFVCPGLRIGWIIGSKKLVSKIAHLKPDGGTNPLASEIAAQLIRTLDWNTRFQFLRDHYKEKVKTAIDHLSGLPSNELKFSRPGGGFFILIKLLGQHDWEQFDALCFELNIVLLRGRQLGNSCDDTIIRLSLASLNAAQIEDGIRRFWAAAQKSKLRL